MQQNRQFIDVEAPTVEEAVRKGIKELNTSIEKIDIEILDEPKKGGFFKRQSLTAKVRLTMIGGAAAPVKEPEKKEEKPAEAKPEQPKKDKREFGRRHFHSKKDRHVKQPEAPVQQAPPSQPASPERPLKPSQPQIQQAPVQEKEEVFPHTELQDKIMESFRTITGMMGFEINPEIIELKNKYRIIVKDAKHANLLIGKNGKTLEALQHIINKMYAGNEAKPIYLDIKGYVKQKRKNRMERHWKKEAQ